MRYYSNISKVMTLSVGIGTGDSSITVDDASGLPVTFPYTVVIDYETASVEVVTVTGAVADTLTVTRGQEDTSAQTHSVGAIVVHAATARDLQEPQDHIAATGNVHGVGLSSAVVGTNTVQVLTGKSISGSANTLSDIPGSALDQPLSLTDLRAFSDTGPALLAEAHATSGEPAIVAKQGTGPSTANLLEFENTAGTTLGQVSSAGLLTLPGIASTTTLSATGAITGGSTATFTGRMTSNGVTTTGTILGSPASTLGATTTTSLASSGAVSGTNITASGIVTGDSVTSVTFATLGGTTATVSANTFNVTAPATNITSIATALTTNVTHTGSFKSNAGMLLRSAANYELTADQASAGAVGSFTDLAGCTTSVTIPAGYTGYAVVRGEMFFSYGVVATMRLWCNVAGVDQAKNTDFSPTAAGLPSTGGVGRTWIIPLTAGTYTIKLRYQNANGTATWTFKTSGTTMAVEVFY